MGIERHFVSSERQSRKQQGLPHVPLSLFARSSLSELVLILLLTRMISLPGRLTNQGLLAV